LFDQKPPAAALQVSSLDARMTRVISNPMIYHNPAVNASKPPSRVPKERRKKKEGFGEGAIDSDIPRRGLYCVLNGLK